MSPDPGQPWEAEGVLNPAAGYTPDGRLHLFPRLVAAGNVSRIGLAEVVIDDGVPTSVQRRGIVLSPDEGWEHGANHGGVEDPRVTFVERLGVHIMTYVAFGPLGPRIALGDVPRPPRMGAARARVVRLPARTRHRPQPVPQQGRRDLPRAGPGPRWSPELRHAAPSDVGPNHVRARRGSDPTARRPHRRPARHLDLLRPPWSTSRPTSEHLPSCATTAASPCPNIPTSAPRSAPVRRRYGSRRAGCSSITACKATWYPASTRPSRAPRLRRRGDAARPR